MLSAPAPSRSGMRGCWTLGVSRLGGGERCSIDIDVEGGDTGKHPDRGEVSPFERHRATSRIGAVLRL
jgi:hypothetical protein